MIVFDCVSGPDQAAVFDRPAGARRSSRSLKEPKGLAFDLCH